MNHGQCNFQPPFVKLTEINETWFETSYGKEETELSKINTSLKCIAVPLSPCIPYYQGIRFSSVQFAEGCWYGVPSPPKIKVGTQHPTLGMNIGLCRVTSIFFECNFELLHAKSDNTNQSST